MSSAQATRDHAPSSSWLSPINLLLTAGWLIIACAGCASKESVACNPPSAVYTPTRWHCWDEGPLAYRCCVGPVQPPQGDAPGPTPAEQLPVPNSPASGTLPPPASPTNALSPQGRDSARYGGNRYFYITDDDPRMNAAITRARATVGDFITALRSPRAFQSGFAVRVAFSDGQKTERLCITNLTFDGRFFYGQVCDEPREIKNIHVGQRVSVDPAQITDWQYTDSFRLVGGFTLREIRERLSVAQRVDFDRGLPFAIE